MANLNLASSEEFDIWTAAGALASSKAAQISASVAINRLGTSSLAFIGDTSGLRANLMPNAPQPNETVGSDVGINADAVNVGATTSGTLGALALRRRRGGPKQRLQHHADQRRTPPPPPRPAPTPPAGSRPNDATGKHCRRGHRRGGLGRLRQLVSQASTALSNALGGGIVMNGNVGIGTSTPLNMLDVSGINGGAAGIYLNDSVPSSTTNTIYNNAGTLTWNGNIRGAAFGQFTSGLDTIVFNDGSEGVALRTNGFTRLYASLGGNVGIGSLAPVRPWMSPARYVRSALR